MEPLLVSPFFKELHSQLKHLPIHLLQYIAYLVHKHAKLGMPPLLGYYQLCKAQAGHNLPLPLHTALRGDENYGLAFSIGIALFADVSI